MTNAVVDRPERNDELEQLLFGHGLGVDALPVGLPAHGIYVDAPPVVGDGESHLGSELHRVQGDRPLRGFAGRDPLVR